MEWMIGKPLDYGGLTLKNRVIFAPTTMGMREDAYLNKLRDIAAGGCAMLIIGDVPVGRKDMGGLFSARGFRHYRRITELAHSYGCKVCAQLHQNDTHFGGMMKYLPDLMRGKVTQSELRQLLNQETGRYITELPTQHTAAITASFGPAAERAAEAGFDLVQVHGDRMCGSFSSALFNGRTDRYGGSVEARTTFATEAVTSIRRCMPQMPIDYKLVIRTENPDYGKAGVTPDELSVFVPRLEAAGVTSFHVSLADHGKLEDTIPPADHPAFHEEGCFLPFCDEVRRYTALPICGVGGLSTPSFVETQLASGRIDCAAMSRQLLADPAWVNKVLENRPEDIHHCIRCNRECLGGMYRHKGVHCIYDGAE